MSTTSDSKSTLRRKHTADNGVSEKDSARRVGHDTRLVANPAPARAEDSEQKTDPAHDQGGVYSVAGQEFTRDTRYITDRIVAHPIAFGNTSAVVSVSDDYSRVGIEPGPRLWPVEEGRYRLVVANACPWAHRAIIVRRLLGLEKVLSMAICGPVHDERSWTFDKAPGHRDEVLGYERLQEAYFARQSGYPRGITVPAIVDTRTGAVVTNDFAQMTLDFSTQWRACHRPGAPDLYPAHQRESMDTLMRFIYTEINNGVYRCGFAGTQEAYSAAYRRLFSALDKISDRLETRRYLMGDHLTEADIRLYTTLIRFDVVYHNHFKCNRSKISEMPVLFAYLRDLYQTPGFGDTTDFVDIKRHYFEVHRDLNPLGIVPEGPDTFGLLTPHGRESLGGAPFDGPSTNARFSTAPADA